MKLSGMLTAVALAACTGTPPSANVSPSTSDEGNIPGHGSGWAQVQAELSTRRATAQAELGEATRAILATGGDCADSCAGVATLRAAVDRLCSIRDSRDDDVRCKEAKSTLATTDARVKAGVRQVLPPPNLDDLDAGL